ncbi:MAG: glycosyltransferase, partial [Candidatus Omnitrophica bacterium]|nr:glycosyltransferase [Candidatus Omnitrophota bacterium]
MSDRKYSIVVPFYNEEKSVRPLYASIKKVMDNMGGAYEMIFVNDGSTDATLPTLKDIRTNDPNVIIVDSPERVGQTKAMRLGFERAEGDTVVSMDGDMQNDPADIPNLVSELEKGYDFVCGWRYP